jgi:hypothetical protein
MDVMAILKINNVSTVIEYCTKDKSQKSRASSVIGDVTHYGEVKILKQIRLLIIKMVSVMNGNYSVVRCNIKNGAQQYLGEIVTLAKSAVITTGEI